MIACLCPAIVRSYCWLIYDVAVTYVRDGQTESAWPQARAYAYPVIGSIQQRLGTESQRLRMITTFLMRMWRQYLDTHTLCTPGNQIMEGGHCRTIEPQRQYCHQSPGQGDCAAQRLALGVRQDRSGLRWIVRPLDRQSCLCLGAYE